jgi:hypothetical protein
MKAGYGLASLEDCDCWLPAWLPDLVGFTVVRMSENSIGFAPADDAALVHCGGGPDVARGADDGHAGETAVDGTWSFQLPVII